MSRRAWIVPVLSILFVLSLSSCGGGGGGSSSVTSPYTGITTPALITDNNADNIARGAFEGGDLGASTVGTLAPARPGDGGRSEGSPAALTIVRTLEKAASAVLSPRSPGSGPAPRTVVTVDNTVSDGAGGSIHYVLSVDDQTGAFTGTFTFANYHGDAGGILIGTVAVSGAVGQDFMQILFDFQSVRIVDGVGDVTAWGTVDLTSGTGGASATLNLVLTDNVTGKTVWLSNYTVAVTAGIDYEEVRLFGRVYLHDFGYVDVHTEAGFVYPTGETLPVSGSMTVTGKDASKARLTVTGPTQYTVEVDADGNGAYELTITLSW